MERFRQILFFTSLVALSWYAMMATHELGHVFGAIVTGGTVEKVVLHPLAISRTDVSPNPHPAAVVWLGPGTGCVLPYLIFKLIPRRWHFWKPVSLFFAGFCLIANGAYISVGSIEGIGDCGELQRTGSPTWLLVAFGAVTIPAGLYCWHRLGSLLRFIADASAQAPGTVYSIFGIALATFVFGIALAPQ